MLDKLTPKTVSLLILLTAAGALASVYIGQFFFGLHPCHLCMYQRYPFFVIIGLSLISLTAPKYARAIIALSGLAFLINAGIAFYHSGVERKWWAGLEGCSTPDMSGSIDELMKRIENAATVSCNDIAFKFLGLSLANYNVILCVVAGLACFAYLISKLISAKQPI